MTDLAALVVRMQADNSSYIKALDQATARLSHFQKEQEDRLKELATKFAEAFAIDKIVEFAASSIEGAASLERFSQSAGISVEALSSLRLAAAASGLSQDELGVSLKKLNVSIEQAAGNASSKAGVAFRGMGIDVTDANGKVKDAGTVLADLATKFSTMADGPNKVALAIALLGKQGQNLIPVLNQGATGLDEFKKQAEEAGIVMSTSLAAAAEEFSQKAAVLKATLVDGLGIQLATQLLPVLTELMDQFKAAGGEGSALAAIAGVLVGGFKIVAAVVIEAVAEFEQVGKSMGALGAIAVAVAHGHFSEATQIWKDSTAENEAIQKSAEDRITAIFEAGGADQLSAISTIEAEKKRIRGTGFNLDEGIASNAALKKLEQFRDTLKEQADAFGLGGAALVKFKLQTGSLAEDLGKAGQAGRDAAAAAIKFAEVLQTKKDDKTVTDYTAKIAEQIVTFNQGTLAGAAYKLSTGAIGEALGRLGVKGEEARASILALTKIEIQQKNETAIQAIDDQTLRLTGHLHEAALAAFDLQNRALKENLASVNDDAGLAKLANQRQQIDYQSQINELNLRARTIDTDLATAESAIALAHARGQVSDITASHQESAVRAAAIGQLDEIYATEKAIAAQANDPALVDGVKKFGVQINTLKVQMTQFEDSVRQGLEQSFAHNFSDLITGAKSFKQALLGFLQDIDKQFADMIAKDYAQKLFAGASGSSSGGALGGLPGLLAGLMGGGGAAAGAASGASPVIAGIVQNGGTGGGIGNIVGSFAGGGNIPRGNFGIVGENGPELAYSGAQDMTIVPAGAASKSVSVTNHFTIEAPGGTISRQSQMQTAAAAARSIGQANHRNNSS
jgi:hypothetical protein